MDSSLEQAVGMERAASSCSSACLAEQTQNHALGLWQERASRGRAAVFGGGDQNPERHVVPGLDEALHLFRG